MTHISSRRWLAALSLSLVVCFVSTATLAANRPAPSTQAGAPAVKDKSQWRKLHRRMSKDEVRNLLGEPLSITVSRYCEAWAYIGSGSVTFDNKGRLDYWLEP